ncbi:MurR/RpiR family transcriptional regulator [Telmatospirillum sp.]|uniref:MurR/RpiR family transcriptional regulator n=1 Tax=Telmatospirillum sp. TaxID=2079197 RepID=UPI002847A32F|nr:MurR/RpiR family transcriptional regulator [Telmatospirillum sp.]MDR3436802.1 MurR/RpiR family transcriptional regulator [Telmatospirillum sp.]
MLSRIESVYPTLRPSEQKLAEFARDRPAEIITLSMSDLAERASVSQATIARFCQAVGCSGFREFKIKLAQAVGGGAPFVHQDVTAGETPAGIIGKVFDRALTNLMQVRNALSSTAVERAVSLLATARRIEFYGAGNSGIVAADLQHKFFRLGLATVAYNDPHVYNMSALTLGRGDVVMAISNSGRTHDILEAAENARSVGAAVVALTHSNSPLARLATVALLADVSENSDLYTPMTSRLTHLTIGDVLAVGVALRRGPEIAKVLTRAKTAVLSRRR